MGQLEKVGLRRESLGFAIGSALFAVGALPGYAIGSVAFGVSAVGALLVPGTHRPESATAANIGTLIGALCFLAAALSMKPSAPGTAPRPGH